MALGLSEVDVTAIVLALIGMLSGWATWWLDRRKHRQEVEGLKADNRQKDLDLSKDSEVAQLRHAIQAIEACPHRDGCPVVDRMQHYSQSE